jgi:DNA-binding transcriptional LysR family regulator
LFRGHAGSQRFTLNGPSGSESVIVQGAIDVDEMGFQLPLAEQGVGIALMPGIAVEASLRAGRLERVLPQYARKDASVYLAYVAQQHAPRRVVLLREFLYEQLSRELATCQRAIGSAAQLVTATSTATRIRRASRDLGHG